ncbi:SdiA-regulated domain-containing protein [Mucilaginibacter sp. L3T2-6]|uniref:SdiA-regulated domain-containing protein n=1 Tax=Mucilaginibacter sp. L3T2-6 TaxID=3062491 RepID=UPI002676AF17|nr:SdiA-regulated domain-containing protein [Mucilaginibacter sp. L3T2-6]MDO3640848.1 SdiA-regulated domain-containing protein [Mucilaginibacter sp. L3T2-6]MDV6213676.1 SdiA-regulated domain-containing protein [Mucilaginibacter sp. L3T2-6]
MKNLFKPIYLYIISCICLFCIHCTGQQKRKSPSPAGYDLNKPVKYNMPDALTEISGIAFNQGDPNVLYAEQDEEGVLFYFKPGSNNLKTIRFAGHGDYEDVAISNQQVVMLRSDGKLYTFPLTGLKNSEVDAVKQKDLLPGGEYEGLYGDNDGSIYALCKHCSIEKTSKTTTIFTLKLAADGTLSDAGQNTIDVKKIEQLLGAKKIAFHPSALAKNPKTGEWYILSSVNKLLVIAGSNWDVKTVYRLDPAIFGQPEGIAFDRDGNLYISNEGDQLRPGNVLKFMLKK